MGCFNAEPRRPCSPTRPPSQVRSFVEATGCPFLPTPMGKGVVRDDHKQCVSAARSVALLHADVVVLIGARLNWMLHFGKPPRCVAASRVSCWHV